MSESTLNTNTALSGVEEPIEDFTATLPAGANEKSTKLKRYLLILAIVMCFALLGFFVIKNFATQKMAEYNKPKAEVVTEPFTPKITFDQPKPALPDGFKYDAQVQINAPVQDKSAAVNNGLAIPVVKNAVPKTVSNGYNNNPNSVGNAQAPVVWGGQAFREPKLVTPETVETVKQYSSQVPKQPATNSTVTPLPKPPLGDGIKDAAKEAEPSIGITGAKPVIENTEASRPTLEKQARQDAAKHTYATKTEQTTVVDVGNADNVLPRGFRIACATQEKIVSDKAGDVSCIVSENIYSMSSERLLIPKGSRAMGKIKGDVAFGDNRQSILFDRIISTNGKSIDFMAQAGDNEGAVGVGGNVNRHWGTRLGAAFGLSFFKDAVAYATAKVSPTGANVAQNTLATSDNVATTILNKTMGVNDTITTDAGTILYILMAYDAWFPTYQNKQND